MQCIRSWRCLFTCYEMCHISYMSSCTCVLYVRAGRYLFSERPFDIFWQWWLRFQGLVLQFFSLLLMHHLLQNFMILWSIPNEHDEESLVMVTNSWCFERFITFKIKWIIFHIKTHHSKYKPSVLQYCSYLTTIDPYCTVGLVFFFSQLYSWV